MSILQRPFSSSYRPLFSVIVAFLVCFCIASLAHAATTYYVAPTGNDANPCTLSSPCRTIAKGITKLTAGDTLYLRDGQYTDGQLSWANSPSGSANSRITVAAYPGETPIWMVPKGSVMALDIWNVGYITFRGITWDGTNGSNNLVSAGYTTTPVSALDRFIKLDCDVSPSTCAHHIRFEENEFRYTAYGVALGLDNANNNEFIKNYIHHIGKVSNNNVFYISGSNNVFDGNIFQDVSGPAIAFWNQSDGTANDNIARNNKIVRAGWFWSSDNGMGAFEDIVQNTPNVRSPGIFIAAGSRALVYNNIVVNSPGGIYAGYGATNCKIYNNTIYGNTAPQGRVGYDPSENAGISLSNSSGGARNCIVRNNIVANQGPVPTISNLGFGNTVSNNLCTASGTGCSIVNSNPQFVNAAANDFHLQSTSPVINAGITIPEVTVDFEGTPRPQGSAFDIGADESGGGESGTPAPTVSLTATPASVQSGSLITITWSVTAGQASDYDWIGLFKTGDVNTSFDPNRWIYTNGAPTGSTTFTAPPLPAPMKSAISSTAALLTWHAANQLRSLPPRPPSLSPQPLQR